MSDSLRLHGLYSPWNSPGQNTKVGSHSLLQGIFPTQGSNPGLPHCRLILYQLSHQGRPLTLNKIAMCVFFEPHKIYPFVDFLSFFSVANSFQRWRQQFHPPCEVVLLLPTQCKFSLLPLNRDQLWQKNVEDSTFSVPSSRTYKT